MRHQIEFGVEPALREVTRARRLAADALRAWDLEAEVPAIELAVRELVASAVREGAGPISVHLRHDHGQGSLHLEVRVPRPRHGPNHRRGRGQALWFVDDVADDRGVTDHDGEVTTWMVRDVRTSSR